MGRASGVLSAFLAAARRQNPAGPGGDEVLVTVDGLPRPATVLAREDAHLLVRFRQSGGYQERWVAAHDVITVEEGPAPPPRWKIAGLAVVAVLGLALLLWPGGSDTPLLVETPGPTPSVSQGPNP